MHEDRRHADDETADLQLIDVRYGFLAAAVEAGHLDLDLKLLEDCRQQALSERFLRASEQVFCLNDTELLFRHTEGHWHLTSILDPEWAHYSTSQQDTWQKMMRNPWNWNRPQTVDFLKPGEAATTPFFRGYEQIGSIDYQRLRHGPLARALRRVMSRGQRKNGRLVSWLQDLGMLQSADHHAQHHRGEKSWGGPPIRRNARSLGCGWRTTTTSFMRRRPSPPT